MPKGVYPRKNIKVSEHRRMYVAQYNRTYYLKNKEKEIARHRIYKENNKEYLRLKEKQRDPIKEKARRKKYASENRLKINAYVSKRYAIDTQFRLKCILRARLYSIMRNHPRNGSAVKDLGCTIEEFKEYLESKFLKGMTWNNWSYKGWHIDHIRPLSLFNLQDRQQFLAACHYTNMQPMWSLDNHKKGNRI